MTENSKKKAEGVRPERIYFRIGDVAEIVGVKPYVLRFWESEFSVISPEKSGSGQRVYRRLDVENLLLIRKLLYTDRYSIEGARKKLKELRKAGVLQAERKAVWRAAMNETPTDEAPTDEARASEAPLEADSSSASGAVSARARRLALEINLLAQRPVEDFFAG